MLETAIGTLSVFLIAASQLLFKSGAILRARGDTCPLILQPRILVGLAMNALAAACWIFALRKLEISYLYPILAINYLLVPLGARLFFGEGFGRRRAIATAIICAGVFICLIGGKP